MHLVAICCEKSLATIVMVKKYIVSRESVIIKKPLNEVLAENTLVFTIGYLK